MKIVVNLFVVAVVAVKNDKAKEHYQHRPHN